MWAVWRPDSISVLNDKKVRYSLARYFEVMQDKKPAKFLTAKKLEADFNRTDSTKELWQIHNQLTNEFSNLEKEIDTCKKSLDELTNPKLSYLDLKKEIALRILEGCQFCTHSCGVNRIAGEFGYCNCGTQIVVSSIFEHFGEEPELVPSGTIFTLGCSLRCYHCQNWMISQRIEVGEIFSPQQLARSIVGLREHGCRNANLVGGDPTPWLEQWLETFNYVNVNVPVVWNSNSYYSEEAAKLLSGFVDVYLLDFKYGSNICAERISNAPDYWKVCSRNHLYAEKNGELIIRVLVLPEHNECCTQPIIDWIAGNLGTGVRVNLMFQYRPAWRANEIPELQRKLTMSERERAKEIALEAGLTNFII